MVRSSAQLLELVKYKTACDLKAEAERTYLGVAWWILEPLIFMGVYYFVFGVLLQRGTDDFVIYLIIGIVFFWWFAGSVDQGQRSILANKNLCSKIPIQKIIFPCISVLKSLFKFGFGLLILGTLLVFFGYEINVFYLYMPLLIFLELIFILGVTLVLSAIVPFVPDLVNLVGHAMRLLLYCSGIFYTTDFIPERYISLFFMNPMAVLIDSYRNVLLYGKAPDHVTNLFALGIFSITLCVLGRWLIFRFDPVYVKRMYK